MKRLVLACALAASLPAQTVNYAYDAAGRLASVTYPNGKVLSYTYDAVGNLLRRVVSAPIAGPTPVTSAAAVVNAASFLGGPVAPGEIITIFGTGIGPSSLASAQLTPFGFLDSLAGDTSVLFDGTPAPLIYASAGQTAAIVPYAVSTQTSTQMTVVYQGRSSTAVTLPVAASAPALFSADSSGKGNGAILNQDNSVNSASNPAAKGSVIVLFGTGEGQTDPHGIDGRIASAVYPKPLGSVKVTIGNVQADVRYAGAAPFEVAGVFQINVVVPGNITSGAVPIVVSVGNASSQPGLTVSIQ